MEEETLDTYFPFDDATKRRMCRRVKTRDSFEFSPREEAMFQYYMTRYDEQQDDTAVNLIDNGSFELFNRDECLEQGRVVQRTNLNLLAFSIMTVQPGLIAARVAKLNPGLLKLKIKRYNSNEYVSLEKLAEEKEKSIIKRLKREINRINKLGVPGEQDYFVLVDTEHHLNRLLNKDTEISPVAKLEFIKEVIYNHGESRDLYEIYVSMPPFGVIVNNNINE